MSLPTPIPFDPAVPGIYRDVPAALYHAATDAISSSMTDLLDPPARLKYWLEAEEEFEPTSYMLMGTFIHQRILEPASPLLKLAVPPEKYPVPADSSLVKTKKAAPGDLVPWHGGAGYCKAWKQNQESAGKIVVTQSFYEETACCVEAVRKDPECQRIFRAGEGELSIIAPYATARGEILRRCRLDWLPAGGNAIVDIKKVGEGKAAPAEFLKLVFARRWHAKAAFYLSCWNHHMGQTDPRTKFVFVAVEDKAPYLVAKYHLSIEALALGARQVATDLEVFAACKADDRWPGYADGIQEVEVPEWMLRKEGLA